MTSPRMTVLVVGATGSIGILVVEEAIRQGHAVRALVRTPISANLNIAFFAGPSYAWTWKMRLKRTGRFCCRCFQADGVIKRSKRGQ